MTSGIGKVRKRFANGFVYALLILGVLPKLLIPIGFMPASLADGGPIAVCGGFAWMSAPESAPPHLSMGQVMDGPATHDSAHEPANTHDDPGDGHEQHHEWERCSFSGFASSALPAGEWQIELLPVLTVRASHFTELALRPTRFTSFRSRAPPLTHS